MNIKKFLFVACFALQFTTTMYASQSNFNAAFLVLGGGSDLVAATNTVIANKGKSSARSVGGIIAAAPLKNSPESVIVSKYLSNQALTSAELTSLNTAFAAATQTPSATSTTTPVATTTTTPPTTPAMTSATTSSATTPTTPAVSADTITAATALKAQIDSSVTTYNAYLQSVSQTPVKLVAGA